MSLRSTVAALALTAAAAAGLQPATAAQPASGVTIEDPWTRSTAPGQAVAGGFMTVVNSTGAEDRLLRASSPIATEVQIHNTTMDGGVMRMRPMTDGVAIPAGGRVEFKPRALHLMFMGLRSPIAAGTTVPMTLEFERAGKLAATFRVEAVAAPASATPPTPAKPVEPAGHHHHDMKHD